MNGEHVSLEPLQAEHAAALWSCVDDAVRAYWPIRMESPGDVRAQVDHLLAQPTAQPFVMRSTSGDVVGQTCLYNHDQDHRHATIGWTFIHPEHRRTAVNTETKLLMLTYAFEGLDLERVQFDVDARNQRSQEAVLRIGATKEGVLRRHKVLWDGFIRDTVIFSIIRAEWPTVKAGLEERLG